MSRHSTGNGGLGDWTGRRMPITRSQAVELVKRLPVNRTAAGTAGRAGAAALGRALPAPLRAPTVPAGVEVPPAESKVGAAYDTEWARSYPARAARVLLVEGVVRPTMDLLATPTVKGTDRLADLDGPVVFAANHHSHVDTPLMLSVIPEPWRHHLFIGAAADYFFGNRVTSTLSALVIGAIPIERTKVTRTSADQAAELIDDGWSMLIFPEGGRSPDGWGQAFRGGAAYLAIRCRVPVVPVHLEGTGRILRKGKNVPRPTPTTVTFGDPIVPGPDDDSRNMAVRIERAVAALADEAGSDWWQARKRAAAGETPSLQGPGVGAWRRTWALGDRRGGRRRPRRAWPEV
ncbi:lysophospholipid acyltransferase family protein [Rhabdothermincola salaria]|uniref:lysophospholipid acyltransferase family protein n=1 Tax=Rhabdothermincola salaria TaxID=2903142 RepID=UPI001E4BF280|nr:lysophospholipid acyltransferase family protein [Rhabdothermincola salaria]MCD9622350.1 1-acyl-sn-glycerol-3-phosphate acyltransferase [Rhabdothermincola salaria]